MPPTLRKDLETLRRYGILDRQMYRWGYYLGTGALRRDELQVAFNAWLPKPNIKATHKPDKFTAL